MTSLTPPLTLLQRLDLTLRCMTPFVITLFLALVPVLPLHLPHETDLVPAFTLMSVFYWTVYRPDLMPASAVFAIGVIQDFAAGAPLGVTSLILLGTHGVVLGQRRLFVGKPFAMAWAGFALVDAAAAAVSWSFASLLAGEPLAVAASLLQFVVTLAVFPILAWFFVRTHRRVLARV
ncbi:MAG TPA: rod shape-determining protein MreD [Candidatus Sulfotelmatobacter sp.]|nr:rod shape-determining protein MreD [Candidatus Sulfotelmatobacter sp.]